MSERNPNGWRARSVAVKRAPVRRALIAGGLLAALLVPTLPGTASAASNEGQYAVKGPGLATCVRFVEEREKRSPAYASALGWIAGYISAYNRFTEDTLDIAPWQSLELLGFLIDQYCQKNPELQFVRAMDAAIGALQPTRLRAASDSVTAEAEGQSVTVYREILRRAQQLLLERGHYQGDLDGLWGAATQAAFRAYQEEVGIQITGLPDQRTLLQLFR